jgi:hypothetical protein
VNRNVPTSIFFLFFMLLTICRLCVLVCILHNLTTFGVNQLALYVASWMYAREEVWTIKIKRELLEMGS